jgi:putative tryptophan/tyrosine transport system substrate-binding protein
MGQMAIDIGRRQFISVLGGAAAWPLAAQAQSAMPVIGYLSYASPEYDAAPLLPAFHQGLREIRCVEGQNVTIEYRWAEFQYERLAPMAADLVRHPVSAIAALGGTPPALAAKATTSTIPIVFYVGVDPVEFGLVTSLNRPGGNMTGIAALQGELIAKRIEILHEMAPKAAVVALLVNPNNRYTETETLMLQDGARSLGLELHVLNASTASDIDTAFGTLAELRPGALLVSADLFLLSRHKQLVALAVQHALPAVYPWRGYVAAGGLMSYGPSLSDAYRLVGVYIGKILKGAIPADLPVEQSTKIELVINLKTSKTLGLTVPITLLSRADDVIE